MPLYNIITILLGILAVSACIMLLLARNRLRQSARERDMALTEAARRLEECRSAEALLREKVSELAASAANLARAETRLEHLEKQAERDRLELEKLQSSFRLEFRNLANEILDEKTNQFRQTNREAMDNLLKPFRENITQFRERVEAIYSDENRQRGALQNEIKNLLELNHRITAETTNLTQALKGNSKVQGDWGEMILDTILESSNLVRGLHYTTQSNLKDESGNNLRPDIILNLPENKRIIIDSKVSLTAYVNHCEAENDGDRKRFLDEHLGSLRNHVRELGSKRYQDLVDSPDFVIMFVANEPAFLTALQCDSRLWSEAYHKKVIVSSPTNLFALLKIVDDLWRRDSQNRNAIEIAEEGGRFYDKLVGFVDTILAIGKNLELAYKNHETALKQLKEGNGNLIRRAEKLRELGVKASKNLPPKMVAESLENETHGELDVYPDGDQNAPHPS